MIYPAIRNVGVRLLIGEIELRCALDVVEERVKERADDTSAIVHRESICYKRILKRFDMAFGIDKDRTVLLTVYIDRDCFWEVPIDERDEAIRSWIKDRSPWFFSYGKRNISPFQSTLPSEIEVAE